MQAGTFHCGQSLLNIPKQAVLLALWFLSCHPMSNSEEVPGTKAVKSELIMVNH